MSKADWYVEVSAVVVRKFCRNMLAKRRGRPPEIDSHVQNATATDAHELGLGVRGSLKMQPAYCSDVGRQREVVLNERVRNSNIRQHPGIINLAKETSPIFESF